MNEALAKKGTAVLLCALLCPLGCAVEEIEDGVDRSDDTETCDNEDDPVAGSFAKIEDETEIGDDECQIPYVEDDSQIIPPSGATVTDDYSPLLFELTAPQVRPGCDGDFELEVIIQAHCEHLASSIVIYESHAVPGEVLSGYLNLEGAVDGDVCEASFQVEEVGANEGVGYNWSFFYGGSNPPVEVAACLAFASSAGASLDIRCRGLAPGGMSSLAGGWSLSGGPDGAFIEDGEISRPGSPLALAEIGWHEYSVGVSDGINDSPAHEFSVPVDLHAAAMTVNVPVCVPPPASSGDDVRRPCVHGGSAAKGDQLYRALLPESVADLLAQECAQGFDPGAKPDSSAEPVLEVDLGMECLRGALEELPSETLVLLRSYPIWRGSILEEFTVGDFVGGDEPGEYWGSAAIEYRSDL